MIQERSPDQPYLREIVALTLIEGLGNWRIRQLMDHFDNAAAIFRAGADEIASVGSMDAFGARRIQRFNRWRDVDKLLETTKKTGATLLPVTDPLYPGQLKRIPGPPPLLWVRGDLSSLGRDGVAVVGTRHADRYGREQAEIWSRRLVSSGLTVISGLAYGIDALAHAAAVNSGGRSIAVLGSGIDLIYPPRNTALAHKMIENGGAVITPWPPGTPPTASNFPNRNHIVSGMGHGVLVIQSPLKGGSMITARAAVDQNREVFVVPHRLDQKRGSGNHWLIQNMQGKLVCKLEDILVEIRYKPVFHRMQRMESAAGKRTSLHGVQHEICQLLDDGQLQLERLAEALGQPAHRLLPVLLEMEIEGLIRQNSGKYFELK